MSLYHLLTLDRKKDASKNINSIKRQLAFLVILQMDRFQHRNCLIYFYIQILIDIAKSISFVIFQVNGSFWNCYQLLVQTWQIVI